MTNKLTLPCTSTYGSLSVHYDLGDGLVVEMVDNPSEDPIYLSKGSMVYLMNYLISQQSDIDMELLNSKRLTELLTLQGMVQDAIDLKESIYEP